MTNDTDLFISYAQSDGDVAAALLDLLQSAGVECFLAEKSITLGTEWDAELRNAIVRAKRVLVIVTQNSRASTWVAAEVGAAWVLQKPVIPALRDVPPEELDGPIKKYQARQIATRVAIDDLVREIAALTTQRRETSRAGLGEHFNSASEWDHLLKVGDWAFDQQQNTIRGAGTHRYLLSSSTYGSRPYRVECRLRFSDLRPEGRINAVNAGIVLGWSVPGAARRYLSVTLSGYSAFVEKIGFRGFDEYSDYEHITEEVPLNLRIDEPYAFSVLVDGGELTVSCNGADLLQASIGEPLVGRVGLRPWRSSLVCERFDVQNIHRYDAA